MENEPHYRLNMTLGLHDNRIIRFADELNDILQEAMKPEREYRSALSKYQNDRAFPG